MNLYSRLLLLAISQWAILTSAAPVLPPPSSLVPRTRHCDNIPGQVAGSYPTPNHRSLPNNPRPLPRAPAYAFCIRGSTRTFILITLSSIIPIEEPLVEDLVSAAMDDITRTMKTLSHDMPIVGGVYTQVLDDVAVWVANSNNHQLTWGVLGTAMVAIGDYFEKNGGWGAVQFAIWDGDNEVGVARIGMMT